MKLKGPIITLIAGVAVAGVLYTLNVNLSNDTARNARAKAAAATSGAGTGAAIASATPSAPPPTSAAPAAPGAAPPAVDGGKATYAGAVDGGAASLAIAVSNGKAIAYVCDGKTAEAWLNGVAAAGQFSLSGAKGNLSATFAGGLATGIVSAGTKQWHFTIKAVAAPSGLYRSAAGVRNKLDASWVVGPNGEQTGIAKDKAGNPVPADPFNLGTRTATVNGETIQVDSITPDGTTSY